MTNLNTEYLWKNGEDFEDHFDSEEYLAAYFSEIARDSFADAVMNDFHDHFSKITPHGSRLLDIGSGPCLHSVIGASQHFSEIYLSDFTTGNRRALQDWRERKPGAHNWTPFINHAAKLEANSAENVENRLRKAIKGILKCDVLDPAILPDNSDAGQFDCITTSSCLEGVCQDVASFRQSVKYIHDLLKEGGHIAAFLHLGDEHYDVGDKVFGALNLTADDVEEAFKAAGFKEITTRVKMYSPEERDACGEEDAHEGFITLFARK